MASQAPKVDFVSKLIFLVSAVALLAVVYILVSSLINTVKRNSTKGEVNASPYLVKAASNNLKPVGVSVTSDAPAASASSATRSGKEVYTAVCAACHSTGAAGAPKVGDKAAWEPRIAAGLDSLMNTAINGKGAMPARGGQNIGDEELKAAIRYMATETGFDLGSEEPVAKETPEATSEVPQEVKKEKTTSKTEELNAPTQPVTPNTPVAPVLATVTETVPATDNKKAVGTTHEVKMLNSGKDGAIMVFDPASLKVAVGDTVKFIPTDSGHNAVSSFTPEGATPWKGAIGQEVSVTIDKEGFYIYSCEPHKALGMFGVILAGNPTNQDAAVNSAKEISSSLAMGKDRLEKYINALK
jgi:pseudoazurin